MARTYIPGPFVKSADVLELGGYVERELQSIDQNVSQYALAEDVLNNFVGVGYGGIGQNANAALPDIGAGWTLYTGFDTDLISAPKYIGQDFVNNGLIFPSEGIYLVTVKVTLAHNESNAGRELNVRFFNATDGVPGSTEFAFGVARNVGTTNLTIPAIPLEIPAGFNNKLIQVQLGNTTDLFTNVIALGGYFSAVHVSNYLAFET